MDLCMLLPAKPDLRWALASQMGIDSVIAKLAPELTGQAPPFDLDSLRLHQARFRAAGHGIVGLEGDQFDMSRIKRGLPGRDEDIERYKRMLANMGKVGIPLLCLNFMVTGWQRTRTAVEARGGAHVTAFDAQEAEALGPDPAGPIACDDLWDHFHYFIRRVAPAAEDAGVRLGLHPDDPPVDELRGVGRILTSADAIERAIHLADSPQVGLTFCQGSFTTMGEDIGATAHRFADRIFFVHVRDVHGTARRFVETFPEDGDSDMAAMFRTYRDIGYDGPIRPDHAPAMAGDPVHRGEVVGTNVGYEAIGMVYTVGYIKGLMQATGLSWSRRGPHAGRPHSRDDHDA
ncbi:MAG: mannonate dehydratase [Microvirga sp.]